MALNASLSAAVAEKAVDMTRFDNKAIAKSVVMKNFLIIVLCFLSAILWGFILPCSPPVLPLQVRLHG